MPHAALTPIPSCPYDRVNGYRGNIDDDSLYTFAYIDIDGTGASVTTVDHDTRDEAAILDVTF